MAEIGTAIGVTIPSPLVTPGPTWAQEISDFLAEVNDGFTAGVRSSIGLTIDSNLALGEFLLTSVGGVVFAGGAAPSAQTRAAYVGVDGELHYVDATGVDVKLTASGQINAASNRGINGDYGVGGNPADVSFLEASNTYVFTQDTGIAGLLDAGAIRVREAVLSANYVELASPTSLAASYQLKFPVAVPASTSLLLMASSGQTSTTRTPTLDGVTCTGTITASFVDMNSGSAASLFTVDRLEALDNGSFSIESAGTVVAPTISGTTKVVTAEADVRHAARTIKVAHSAAKWITSGNALDSTQIDHVFSGYAQHNAVGSLTRTGLIAVEVPTGCTITTVVANVKSSTGTPAAVRLVSVDSVGSTVLVGTATGTAAATNQTLTIGSLSASTTTLWYVIEVDLTDSGARLYNVTYTYTRP